MNGRWLYFQLQYPRVRRLLAAAARGQAVQTEVWREKVRLAAESLFGREHRLGSIRSREDFRRQLPIADFEYYRPYVDQVRSGRHDALFGPKSPLLMFALTSGTTEKPKLIPVTSQFVASYKRGWKIWGLQTHADHRDLLTKDYLHLASDWQQSQTPAGTWCGNISGLAAETRPAIVRRPFIVPPQVAKIRDWTHRQYAILRLALPSRQLGMIITANPLTLIKLAELADQEKESLLRDLRDGTIRFPGGSETTLDPLLQARIKRVERSRVRELEEVAERTGSFLPRDLWPQLSVVAVWMGGPVAAFVPEVRRLYGPCAFRDHGLSASEGRMTIPMRDEANAGLLDFTSNYYEFIPVGEYGTEQPTVLEAHELIEGESYYILLTNSGGLFRYDIRDVVQCVGFEGQVPLLSFLHKGAHCANVAGEKLTEYQVASAIHRSFEELQRPLAPVMLVPVMEQIPYYALMVEPGTRPYAQELAAKLDAHLAELNCEYEDRLRTRRLLATRVREVPAGSWDRVRERKIAIRGGSQEQYKHSFLGSAEEIERYLSSSASGTL